MFAFLGLLAMLAAKIYSDNARDFQILESLGFSDHNLIGIKFSKDAKAEIAQSESYRMWAFRFVFTAWLMLLISHL